MDPMIVHNGLIFSVEWEFLSTLNLTELGGNELLVGHANMLACGFMVCLVELEQLLFCKWTIITLFEVDKSVNTSV